MIINDKLSCVLEPEWTYIETFSCQEGISDLIKKIWSKMLCSLKKLLGIN